MKNFKDQLDLFEKDNLQIYKVLTALEVELSELADREDSSFEGTCRYVYQWIMNTEMTPGELCHILSDGLAEKEITIEEILKDDPKVKVYVNIHV